MNRRRTAPPPPRWRSGLLIGLFAVAAGTLEARLVWLQLFESEFLAAEGEQRQLRRVEVSAHRGLLRDRNGEPLAVSTPVDSVFVDPNRAVFDRDQLFELARLVDRDGDELEREITSRLDRRFLWIKRRLPPSQAAEAMALGLVGFDTQREYQRFYPAAEVTCHLVGFSGDDDTGQEGLELVYNAHLSGRPGQKLVQLDERRRIIADVEEIEAVRPGRDLRTSIDLRLQYSAYLALKAAVTANGASSGSVVLLDVATGEVLAMVNQPACNPNNKTQRSDLSRFRNRAITDPIEPGSTIKPLILAAALANGTRPDDPIHVPKTLIIDGEEITADENELGDATITDVLARSSSVGLGLIGAGLDSADIWQTLKAFGFGEQTAQALGSLETRGVFSSNHANWDAERRARLSYGYTLSVSPLQLARAYNIIASGGWRMPVSFEPVTEPPERIRAIDAGVASDLISMLEAVVADTGTASRAAVPNYRVAGKTGTVEVSEGGGYTDKRRALFAGMAPASRPRFVAVVVISEPRGRDYFGGQIAAPVFSQVMAQALRLYGVAPDDLPETMLVSDASLTR